MRPPNDNFTIPKITKDYFTSVRSSVKGRQKPKIRGRESFKYWELSVRRISIFADTPLSAGYLEDGRVDLDTRFDVCLAFREFMKLYADKKNQPFTRAQEAEIRRVLKNGVLT